MDKGWNEMVWDLVKLIPKGRVVSYGQIAGMLGEPRRARHVGFALNRTPEAMVLPWHRVINGRGRISFSEHSEQYLLQKAMLEAEQVSFNKDDRIDLKKYGWHP